ncbi:MAG: putative toxin-antitoxin system toxin component, PIN family [Candidatus Omnitrophica bacterium]|nr:putative toxin-antitoxin system toxin component, PIN family [Candidatus Omnitrophota bacterium]
MLKVVLDSNILISSLLPSKLVPIREALKLAKFTLVSSPPIFNELLEVVNRPKIASIIDPEAKSRLIELIRENALFVSPPKSSTIIINEDRSDDHFLHAAKTAKANFIVSGDKHLTELKSYAEIPIISAKEFLAKLSLLK